MPVPIGNLPDSRRSDSGWVIAGGTLSWVRVSQGGTRIGLYIDKYLVATMVSAGDGRRCKGVQERSTINDVKNKYINNWGGVERMNSCLPKDGHHSVRVGGKDHVNEDFIIRPEPGKNLRLTVTSPLTARSFIVTALPVVGFRMLWCLRRWCLWR